MTLYAAHEIITSARTTGQTVLDSDGKLKWALHNIIPRCDLSHTDWTKDGLTSVAESGVSPSGKAAYLLTENTATGLHRIYDSVSYVAGDYYSHVFDVKASGRDFSLILASSAFGADVQYDFDLAAVTATQTVSGTKDAASITLISGSWYRVVLSAEATSTSSTWLRLYLTDGGTLAYTGDGASGVYLSRPRIYKSAVHAPATGIAEPGGMQLGTDGTDYVETTGTAVYHLGRAYDGSGACLGMQSFEGRTNLVTDSDVYTAGWTPANITRTANSAASPDGTVNATKLAATAAGASSVFDSISVTPGNHVASIYAKQGTSPFIRVGMYDSGVGWATLVDIDLSTGTSPDGADVVSVGDGWYRISATGNITSATVALYIYVTSDIAGAVAVGGEEVYVYGAHLEAGSFPTPYIPTNGSAVARAADNQSIDLADFGFNADEGTIVVEFQAADVNNQRVFELSDGTTNNFMTIYINSSNVRWYITSGGVSQANIVGATGFVAGQFYRLALAYKANDFAISVDGAAVMTDTSGSVPSVNVLHLGVRNLGTSLLNGEIKSFLYYPTRLANATLEAESA